jgi:hypothetical protein
MKIIIHSKYYETRVRAVAMLLFAACSFSLPVFAALGGNLDSVYSDQAHMNAILKVTQASSFAVHELRTPTGTVIREYVSAEGRVFGVAWEGPFVPNMQLILGSYFQHYSEAAKAQRESQVGRRPLNIQEPGLVVQTAGHMRAYFGRAYDPELLPSGVSPNDVR